MIDTIKLRLDLEKNRLLEKEIYRIKNRKTRLVTKCYVNELQNKINNKERVLRELNNDLKTEWKIRHNTNWDEVSEVGLDEFKLNRFKKLKSEQNELKFQLENFSNETDDVKRHIIINYAKQSAYGGVTQATIQAPSHSYEVRLLVNTFANEIIIEFSIPKFFYGTNLFEFLPSVEGIYYGRNKYSYDKASKLRALTDATYERLYKAVRYFFSLNFGIAIDMKTVQVQRIDFCSQQYFDNKEELNDTCNHLKKIDKKYKRVESKHYSFDSTPVYVPSTYTTFKIYKKGVEFEKHDLPVLQKGKGHVLWDDGALENFQSVANRVLRYETEFRNSGINEIYNNTILKKIDGFDEYYRMFRDIDNITKWRAKKSIFTGKKVTGKLWTEIKPKYRQYFKRVDIYKEPKYYYSELDVLGSLKKEYEKYKKWRDEKRIRFCFAMPRKHDKYSHLDNKIYIGHEKPEVLLFSKDLFYELAKKHFSNIDEYRLKKRDDLGVYMQRVDKYNAKRHGKGKLNKGTLKRALTIMIKEKLSLSQYRKEYEVPKSSYYYLKGNLELIDFGSTSASEKELSFPEITPNAFYDNILFPMRWKMPKMNYVGILDSRVKKQKFSKISLQ